MTNEPDAHPREAPTPPDEAGDGRDAAVEAPAFPVVGVGASAGGLEAFTQLLKALPPDTGMAFVLVQHLAPTHPSALAEILGRVTAMPVSEVQDESAVEPNHVYVIPPDRGMTIVRGALQLLPREGHGVHRPIDRFFRSLAEERRHRAIGVVLSGTASDGTTGLEAIKAEGGITFAQDATAQHDGMPRSAVASGCVDFVLSPVAIAGEIVRIGKHPYAAAVPPDATDKPNLARVVQLLHQATGVDFAHYKVNTLYRRVARRMVFQKIEGVAEYVGRLQQTPGEAEALFQDILIGVTSFFRDPDAFDTLKTRVFPRLLAGRARNDPVRLWTIGCSTGQEAYSLAIAFTEAAEAAGSSATVQVFATDLNPAGIEKARAGVYSKDLTHDVSPERLRRFFTEVDGSYRISKMIRDACVFSRHNVLADPPFSRIDLISCRNLIIYLEPVLQRTLVPILHYALKPGGYLWLGESETISGYRRLFEPEDAKHRIYVKRTDSTADLRRPAPRPARPPRAAFVPLTARPGEAVDLPREADRLLLGRFAPPGVLVTAELDILQFRGDTEPYLTPAPGKASLSLLKMLREDLLVAVRTAVARAGKDGAPVREEGLRVKNRGGEFEVAIEVIPIKGDGAREAGFLVLFENSSMVTRAGSALGRGGGDGPPTAPAASDTSDADYAHLFHELSATRELLQSLSEQYEAANEELQSANEEIQSANEELQSTNEELETSKEEIQSSNEELATVNDELNNRNAELNRVNNDLVNLLESVQMAIVMLGPDLRIRRFTPMAEKLLGLIPSDTGRALVDIKLPLDDLPDLEPTLVAVLETVTAFECDVRDRNGRWYSLRLRPYRTQDNRIDGVVALLVDMADRKQAEAIVKTQNDRLHLLWESAGALLSTGDPETMLHGLMPKAGSLLGVDACLNHMLDDSGSSLRLVSSVGIPTAETGAIERREFENDVCGTVVLQGRAFEATHIQQSEDPRLRWVRSLGFLTFVCNPLMSDGLALGTLAFGSRTRDEFDPGELAVLQTISRYVAMAYERLRLLSKLRDTDRRKNEFLATLAHELRNPLAPVSNALKVIQMTGGTREAVAAASAVMERQIGHLIRLVDDLLDVSRISQGKIELRRERVDLSLAVNHAVEDARTQLDDMKHVVSVDLPRRPVYVSVDPTRLAQVLGNLLNNACKYTDTGGRLAITAEQDGEQALIRVRDTGIGLTAEQLSSIFDLFMQVDTSPERSGSGLGIGLTLVKALVELHGGTVDAHSAGIGQGSEFVVRLPMAAGTPGPGPGPEPEPEPNAVEPTDATSRRILVVDDNQDSAASLAMLLELGGSETFIANDGVEALEVAARVRPDVVLLDLGLPGLNGYEVARRIREQPWGGTMVLVAVSGWSQAEARRESTEAGFDEHLVKPVDHAVLMRVLAARRAGGSAR